MQFLGSFDVLHAVGIRATDGPEISQLDHTVDFFTKTGS